MNKSTWDRYRVEDHLMSTYVNQQDMVFLDGAPGTTAFVASGDVYHKGGHCLTADRLMLEISYQSDGHGGGLNIMEQLKLTESELQKEIQMTEIRKYMIGGFKERRGNSFLNRMFRSIDRRERKVFTWNTPQSS